jgi:hypothetical protein
LGEVVDLGEVGEVVVDLGEVGEVVVDLGEVGEVVVDLGELVVGTVSVVCGIATVMDCGFGLLDTNTMSFCDSVVGGFGALLLGRAGRGEVDVTVAVVGGERELVEDSAGCTASFGGGTRGGGAVGVSRGADSRGGSSAGGTLCVFVASSAGEGGLVTVTSSTKEVSVTSFSFFIGLAGRGGGGDCEGSVSAAGVTWSLLSTAAVVLEASFTFKGGCFLAGSGLGILGPAPVLIGTFSKSDSAPEAGLGADS